MRSTLQRGKHREVDPVLKVVHDLLPLLVHWANTFTVEDEASPEQNRFSFSSQSSLFFFFFFKVLLFSFVLYLSFTELYGFPSYLAPRRDLWVVEVTMSACSKGEETAPAATSPLIWAMSASMYALMSVHNWKREKGTRICMTRNIRNIVCNSSKSGFKSWL